MKNGRRFGSPPKPYRPPERPTGKINVTDPDSRNLKTPRGYLQGYNAQAVCNEHQIVLAAAISVSSADFGLLGPMVTAVEHELTAAGILVAPEVVLADAGYWHGEQMDELTGRGIQVLIRPDSAKRQGARPGWNGGRYAFMRRVLEGEIAGELYRRRQVMVEPIFADTRFNRGINRFLRRGRSAARSEWRLITAGGNLLKLPPPTPARQRLTRASRQSDRVSGPLAHDLHPTRSSRQAPPGRIKAHRLIRSPKDRRSHDTATFRLGTPYATASMQFRSRPRRGIAQSNASTRRRPSNS
jgi:hypothetical protein